MNPDEIGERIRIARKRKFPSRNDFAEALQTSEANVKRIERGGGLPSIDLLVRISILLETTTDFILFGRKVQKEEIERLQTLLSHLSQEGRVTFNNIGQELIKLERSRTNHMDKK
ncbi:helix-turn-helix domain-containing protein [Paenibacillus sp. HJGM_3]|uniref:helix-turn-helix domain-containing protein n=1 Tax=Paenibacillus sp. HJGM_3 TaxID=3379816 RepID=UPI00385BBD23